MVTGETNTLKPKVNFSHPCSTTVSALSLWCNFGHQKCPWMSMHTIPVQPNFCDQVQNRECGWGGNEAILLADAWPTCNMTTSCNGGSQCFFFSGKLVLEKQLGMAEDWGSYQLTSTYGQCWLLGSRGGSGNSLTNMDDSHPSSRRPQQSTHSAIMQA